MTLRNTRILLMAVAITGLSCSPVGSTNSGGRGGGSGTTADSNALSNDAQGGTSTDGTTGTDGIDGFTSGASGTDAGTSQATSGCDPSTLGETCEKLSTFCYCNRHFLCDLSGTSVHLLESCSEGKVCDPNYGCTDCIPQCDGKECGDNGCGGTCGTCADGVQCTLSGVCLCNASCDGKNCGDDGCGGLCGTCPEGVQCLAGKCDCTGNCIGKACGDDGCGGSCGDCLDPCGKPSAALCQQGTCVQDPTGCCAQCDGKQCGDDGCGGTCGSCPEGLSCSGGQCVEQTGGVCLNDADQKLITEFEAQWIMYAAFECYFLGCAANTSSCVSQCLVSEDKKNIALSEGCRNCYGDFVSCLVSAEGCNNPGQAASNCFLFGWQPYCDSCMTSHPECKAKYEECSGTSLDPVITALKNLSGG